jgi:hypothetical protein
MLKKEHLIATFNEAIVEEAKYIYVECYADGSKASELIINPIENAKNKRDYYDRAYDDNLKLHNAPVRILRYGYFNEMSQMEYVRNNFESGGVDDETK